MNSLKSIQKARKREHERKYTRVKHSTKILVCDDCKHEFLLKSVAFQEADFMIRGHKIRLTFFSCPKCNKIYKTLLSDEHYQSLFNDYLKSKETLERVIKKQASEEIIERHMNICNAKLKRVEAYENHLCSIYPGTFTFKVSQNNQKEIIYTE